MKNITKITILATFISFGLSEKSFSADKTAWNNSWSCNYKLKSYSAAKFYKAKWGTDVHEKLVYIRGKSGNKTTYKIFTKEGMVEFDYPAGSSQSFSMKVGDEYINFDVETVQNSSGHAFKETEQTLITKGKAKYPISKNFTFYDGSDEGQAKTAARHFKRYLSTKANGVVKGYRKDMYRGNYNVSKKDRETINNWNAEKAKLKLQHAELSVKHQKKEKEVSDLEKEKVPSKGSEKRAHKRKVRKAKSEARKLKKQIAKIEKKLKRPPRKVRKALERAEAAKVARKDDYKDAVKSESCMAAIPMTSTKVVATLEGPPKGKTRIADSVKDEKVPERKASTSK